MYLRLFHWIETTYNIDVSLSNTTSCNRSHLALPTQVANRLPRPWWEWVFLVFYLILLAAFIPFCTNRMYLTIKAWRHRKETRPQDEKRTSEAINALIQLPIYNEKNNVVEALHALSKLQPINGGSVNVQIIDDSDKEDPTSEIVEETIAELRLTCDLECTTFKHIRRNERVGYKAGALNEGLKEDEQECEVIAIFDADFRPHPNFLLETWPNLQQDGVAFVQCRWTYRNSHVSLIAALQANLLNAHFYIEQFGRFVSEFPVHFNGTAGIWRREAVWNNSNNGRWSEEVLTEDLHLSYVTLIDPRWRGVFRKDTEVSSEVPSSYSRFVLQQQRWVRGGIQTAKFLGSKLRTSEHDWGWKFSAWCHLYGNIQYLFLLLLCILQIFVQSSYVAQLSPWVRGAEWAVFFLGAIVLWLFFFASRRMSRPDIAQNMWTTLVDSLSSAVMVVATFVLGAALCINNGIAVLAGLLRGRGEFHRTPKGPDYRSPRRFFVLNLLGSVGGALLFGYMALSLSGYRPFLWFFLAGFCFSTGMLGVEMITNFLDIPRMTKSEIWANGADS